MDFTPFDKGFKRLVRSIYMKKLFAVSLALVLLGQGCLPSFGSPSAPIPTALPKAVTPIETTPSSTRTELTVIAPEGWTRFEHTSVPDFSFYYPGTEATGTALMGLDRGELAAFNLPSNAVITTQRFFPSRSMTVTIFSEDSAYVNGCYYNLRGEATTRDSQTNLPPVRINDRTWCVSTSGEGAAGNYYNETGYATNIGTQVVVFHFTVHSNGCGATENPPVDCISYDEIPDTSDFREIITTFMQ